MIDPNDLDILMPNSDWSIMEGTITSHIPRETVVLRTEKAMFYKITSKLFRDPGTIYSHLLPLSAIKKTPIPHI